MNEGAFCGWRLFAHAFTPLSPLPTERKPGHSETANSPSSNPKKVNSVLLELIDYKWDELKKK